MSPLTQTSLLLALEQPDGNTLSLPSFPREVGVGKRRDVACPCHRDTLRCLASQYTRAAVLLLMLSASAIEQHLDQFYSPGFCKANPGLLLTNGTQIV